MQASPRTQAGPADITRIPMDFRGHEHHVAFADGVWILVQRAGIPGIVRGHFLCQPQGTVICLKLAGEFSINKVVFGPILPVTTSATPDSRLPYF
jgi:hypothetical protein